jgi:hypothetical protein
MICLLSRQIYNIKSTFTSKVASALLVASWCLLFFFTGASWAPPVCLLGVSNVVESFMQCPFGKCAHEAANTLYLILCVLPITRVWRLYVISYYICAYIYICMYMYIYIYIYIYYIV